MSKYLIAIATYNERESLPGLVEALLQETDQIAEAIGATFDFLIVDDDSPDGTGQWCDEFATKEPRLKCLHRIGEKGLGSAVMAAMRYAIEHGYDRMINMDADFSHHPRHLPALCGVGDMAPLADVVIGSRYVKGGGTVGWSLIRKAMSRCINAFARWRLWLPVHDTSGSFRNYSVEKLRQIDFSRVQANGYAFFEEILWRLRLVDSTMSEVPILFEDRQLGKSKMNLKESLRAVFTLLGLRR